MTVKTKLAMLVSIILWASAFVGIRAGLQAYSPEGLALLRFIIASGCMGVLYFLLPTRNKISLKDKITLMCSGAIGIGLYNISLNHGEQSVPSGMASFVVSQSPITTALFALLVLKESLTLPRILGFAVSIAGVSLMLMGSEGGLSWSADLAYIFIATFSGSCFMILQKPLLGKYHVVEATTYAIWGGTLFLAFYAPQMVADLQAAPMNVTWLVIYLGIFPAAVGYASWSYVLSKIPAARAASFLYFMPFVATLMGWLLLDETPAMISLVGGMFAIAGVWLVNQSYRMPQIKVAEAQA